MRSRPPRGGEAGDRRLTTVPDASVFVEVLLRTPTGHTLAPRLARAELIAPELLDADVTAAIRRAVLRDLIDHDHAREALSILADWPIHRVSNRHLTVSTIRWWPNVTAYDAMYVAVAAATGGTLLTADGPLSRAPRLEVPVENIRVTGD